MNDLISLVMKAAASELLHQEASQVEREMKELLAELALVPATGTRLVDFTQHFLTLLKRRGNIAQRALGMPEADIFAIFKPSAGLETAQYHISARARQTRAAG